MIWTCMCAVTTSSSAYIHVCIPLGRGPYRGIHIHTYTLHCMYICMLHYITSLHPMTYHVIHMSYIILHHVISWHYGNISWYRHMSINGHLMGLDPQDAIMRHYAILWDIGWGVVRVYWEVPVHPCTHVYSTCTPYTVVAYTTVSAIAR